MHIIYSIIHVHVSYWHCMLHESTMHAHSAHVFRKGILSLLLATLNISANYQWVYWCFSYSHHQLPRTLPGSPDHYPLSCDSDPPEASASVPTLVTTPVPISSRPFLCMEDDPYMIPQMFTCAESYVPHQLSFTSNSNCSSNILDTTGTATSSSTGTNGSRSSVHCCVYDYAGCCHTDDVAAYETAIEEECTFNCNESEQLFNCS